MPEAGKPIITSCSFCNAMYQIPPNVIGKKVVCKKCRKEFTAEIFKRKKNQLIPQICHIAIHYKFVEKDIILKAISDYNARIKVGEKWELEEFLIQNKVFTDKTLTLIKDIEKVWGKRQLEKQFGMIAIKAGFASAEEVKLALKKQKIIFLKAKKISLIGDILVKDGIITEKHRDAILRKQKRIDEKNVDLLAGEKPSANNKEAEVPPVSPPEKEDVDHKSEPAVTDVDPAEVKGDVYEGAGFEIVVTDDKLRAYFRTAGNDTEAVAVFDIHTVLDDNEITYGVIRDAEIRSFLEGNPEKGAPLLIAEGTAPEAGKEGKITIHFDTSPPKAGKVNENGTIDFKDRGAIPSVEKGDLLAEKVPCVQGIPGIDVFGNPIPVESIDDPLLLIGSGVSLSDDSLRVFADVKGQPQLSVGGKVSVLDELKIEGDVGYKTGHVEFEGNIIISGSIKNGFKVKGGNVTVKEVIGAEVETTGELIVTDGITDSSINSLGSVSAMFINKSKVSTFGDVLVGKQIGDSRVICGGACKLPRGKIISSEVSAKYGIEVIDVGTDISSPCKLKAGVDEHLAKEISGINDAIDRTKAAIKDLEQRKNNLVKEEEQSHLDIAEYAHVQDRSQVEQRNLKKEIAELEASGNTKEISRCEAKIRELQANAQKAEEELELLFEKQDKINDGIEGSKQRILKFEAKMRELQAEKDNILSWSKKEKGIAVVKATGMIYAGTIISGVHSSRKLTENVSRAQIKEVRITDPDSSIEYEMRMM